MVILLAQPGNTWVLPWECCKLTALVAKLGLSRFFYPCRCSTGGNCVNTKIIKRQVVWFQHIYGSLLWAALLNWTRNYQCGQTTSKLSCKSQKHCCMLWKLTSLSLHSGYGITAAEGESRSRTEPSVLRGTLAAWLTAQKLPTSGLPACVWEHLEAPGRVQRGLDTWTPTSARGWVQLCMGPGLPMQNPWGGRKTYFFYFVLLCFVLVREHFGKRTLIYSPQILSLRSWHSAGDKHIQWIHVALQKRLLPTRVCWGTPEGKEWHWDLLQTLLPQVICFSSWK